MTSVDWEAQREWDLDGALNPIRGDRWTEMYAYYIDVMGVDDLEVKIWCGSPGARERKTLSRHEFARLVHYDNDREPNGACWCHRMPMHLKDVKGR